MLGPFKTSDTNCFNKFSSWQIGRAGQKHPELQFMLEICSFIEILPSCLKYAGSYLQMVGDDRSYGDGWVCVCTSGCANRAKGGVLPVLQCWSSSPSCLWLHGPQKMRRPCPSRYLLLSTSFSLVKERARPVRNAAGKSSCCKTLCCRELAACLIVVHWTRLRDDWFVVGFGTFLKLKQPLFWRQIDCSAEQKEPSPAVLFSSLLQLHLSFFPFPLLPRYSHPQEPSS